jgi:DNA-binding NtrC family response regulator
MQAQRILVIEESEVVRETLALILGREFIVLKRSFGQGALSFTDNDRNVDLLILGVTPTIGTEPSSLLRFADKAPFAVLFLVDSKSAARAIQTRERVGCLAKPFNPYELREKVGQLLARRTVLSKALSDLAAEQEQGLTSYLEFPYLTRSAATLVHRFVDSRLPILICGEIGCGQERVARAIHSLTAGFGRSLSLNAADISLSYLEQKSLQLSWSRSTEMPPATLIVENLDRLPLSGQSEFLDFLEQEESRQDRCRILSTARTDLLEKVYQGELLEALYYKLAILKVTLSPLRERREDVPAIANWFARFYAAQFDLEEVSLSTGANERLSHYLWFGNLNEMEAVIARTLAVHRKHRVEAADLVFDFSGAEEASEPASFEPFLPSEGQEKIEQPMAGESAQARNGLHKAGAVANGHDKADDLNILIHELAHEFKNPMVSIKTFTQLLSDRYQDEDFRTRFQDIVGSDIERMDDLLEVMIEFAEFAQPRCTQVALREKLRSVLDELASECIRRQVQIRWKGSGYGREVLADETQVKYALKNVVLAVLSQVKMGSEVEIDVEKPGCVVISYLCEAGRVASIAHYFGTSSSPPIEPALPLRVLLAKQLVERNGGEMTLDRSDPETETLRMEFPIA